MALLDKAKELAVQAKEKGEEAVATGKLMLKIKDEEKNLKDLEWQIGKFIVEKLDDGQEFDQRVMDYYGKVKESKQRIADLKEEQAQVGDN